MPGRPPDKLERPPTAGEDRPFLQLNDDWRLAYDALQFILQRRTSFDRRRGVWNWKGVSFVHRTTAVLLRCIREKGVEVTPEARAALAALPSTFPEFLAWQAAQGKSGKSSRASTRPPAPGRRTSSKGAASVSSSRSPPMMEFENE